MKMAIGIWEFQALEGISVIVIKVLTKIKFAWNEIGK